MALIVHSQLTHNGAVQGQAPVSVSELVSLLGVGAWRRPAYAGLSETIRKLILDGRLPVRARLPSERDLAAALRLSRTTITAAYESLARDGYVERRQGSGTRVSLPTGGLVDREFSEEPLGDDVIDMTVAALPAPAQMADLVARAARDLGSYLGGTGYDPRGLPVLRRRIADEFVARGVRTSEDEIVVTSGAQQALALLMYALLGRQDLVLLETPTYPNALEAARRADLGIMPLAFGSNGWDVDRFAEIVKRERPRLAFMIPDFHNPTGLLMAESEREVIARAAEEARTTIVVDETFAGLDLEPWRPTPRPMAAYGDGVITIGSVSKAYWGGLRIGWIRCDRALAHRLRAARISFDLASPVLDQLVATRLLLASDAVLSERRHLVRSRRDALASALRRVLPDWSFVEPRGGLSLWVELPSPMSSVLAEEAVSSGVRVTGASVFGVNESLDDRLRLPFTQPPTVLNDAVSRLADAARRLESDHPRHHAVTRAV
jgi:DNA-binding transcriptional MocR family regulator